MNYRQCKLSRIDDEGCTITMVSWIPEKKGSILVQVGSIVELKDQKGLFWKVESMSSNSLSEDVVSKNSRKWRKYREATDV